MRPRNQKSKDLVKKKSPEESSVPQWKRYLIISFISFNAFIIALFSAPPEGLVLSKLRDFSNPYMLCFGLTERWDTFAPHPKSSEQFLKAMVITLSGESDVYSFPRMQNLSYMERYRKERYRKFEESILCDACSGLWPDVERNVAQQMVDQRDPPDRVILIKFESPIDPRSNLVGDDKHATPTVLSELSIQPEDLQ